MTYPTTDPPTQRPLDGLPAHRIPDALRVLALLRKHGTYFFATNTPDALAACDLHCYGWGRLCHDRDGWRIVGPRKVVRS